jgi:hypothetical protein
MSVGMTHRSGDPVSIDADECAHLVEVHGPKLGLLDYLSIEPSPKFHHQQQHIVIGSTREEDLSCIKFVECAAD